jgi:hypothetical protein
MILVVSKDDDFSGVIAELLQQELPYGCKALRSADEAKPLFSDKVKLVITSEIGVKWPVPVLVLTRQDAPIRMQKLLADIVALQHNSNINDNIAIGPYDFQPMAKRVSHGEKSISLTDKEAQLLQVMFEAGKKGVTKEALLKEVWGFETDMDTHTLETHIYRLRAKLRELGEEQTVLATENGYTLGIKE